MSKTNHKTQILHVLMKLLETVETKFSMKNTEKREICGRSQTGAQFHLPPAIVAPVFTALRVRSTNVWSDLVFATNKGTRVVRAVVAFSVHFLVMAKVFSVIVTLGVTACAVVTPKSQVYHSRAALMRCGIVGFFSA